jgi:hypothetical protein
MSSQSSLIAAFAAAALDEKQDFGVTWNGDINYASLGNDVITALLEMDQKMVRPMDTSKTRELSQDFIIMIDNYYMNVLTKIKMIANEKERAAAFNILFRYMFYLRSVRAAGKKERLLFYYLFERLYKEFSATCNGLLALIPDFGRFQDIDELIIRLSAYPDFIKMAMAVYKNNLNADCIILFGKQIKDISHNEAKAMNSKLKPLTPSQLKEIIGNKHFSLAAKWFARSGKQFSEYRKKFLLSIYDPNNITSILLAGPESSKIERGKKQLNYYDMVFRNIITSITMCLNVNEQLMCETNPMNRTWKDIDFESAPAGFITKNRKALANEDLKENILEHMMETGNRYPDNTDRVECREHLLAQLMQGKLKGASLDISKLSNIIYDYTQTGRISNSLTSVERQLITAQWNDIVSKLKQEINEILMAAKIESEDFIDPLNTIPIVDTSGSMDSAMVSHIARGLGVLAASISNLPGCMITFSEKPMVFHLNMEQDVFDHFIAIANGPVGYNTNIDATYRVLLNMMVSKNLPKTDYSMLILTDGMFDSLVTSKQCFQSTFVGRLETAFNAKGYNLPRTIFWNLNGMTPGFPSAGDTKGIQLVSGYSQTLMKQVFTGDYKYEVQADGNVRVSVDPIESFLKALMIPEYDIVSQTIVLVGEGCLKFL